MGSSKWASVLAVGDLHLRKTAPAMRTDDFLAAQERKLDEIFQFAEENNCPAVVFPGDVFDRADAPHGLVEWAINRFWGHDLQYLFVFGQHDLRYHTSDYRNTPLGVLCAALPGKARILLPDEPFVVSSPAGPVAFWGCSWGVPLPQKLQDGAINVIVMHRPVTAQPLPWEHPDLLTVRQLFKACPDAELFITGDNHTQFCVDLHGNRIINLGSVMRTTTAQVNHHPAAACITFKRHAYTNCFVKLLPFTIRNGVFNLEAAEAEKANDERLAAFVNSLSGEYDPELRFVDNLRAAAEGVPERVKNLLHNVMQDVR